MHNTPYQRENIHIRGHLLHYLALGLKFSGFQCAKTSVNKRLFMFPLFYAVGTSGAAVLRRQWTVLYIVSSVTERLTAAKVWQFEHSAKRFL